MTIEAARINQTLYIVENRLSEKLQNVTDLSNQSLQQTILLYSAVSELSLLVEDLKTLTSDLIVELKKLNGTGV